MIRSLLSLCILLLLVSPATAQIVNGDFEAGGTGWTVVLAPPGGGGPWTISFPAAGGNPNGYANIHSPFGDSGGESCITQDFQCGEAGTVGVCDISLDYRHMTWDSSPLAGRVNIYIDGVLVHTSPPVDDQGWTGFSFVTECGPHRIELCLEVDPGNNGWEACFDNVLAECDDNVPVQDGSWGAVKALYDN